MHRANIALVVNHERIVGVFPVPVVRLLNADDSTTFGNCQAYAPQKPDHGAEHQRHETNPVVDNPAQHPERNKAQNNCRHALTLERS